MQEPSVQIEIPEGRPSRLILGLLEGFFELAVEQFRLDLLVVGALTKKGFAPFGFLLEKLSGGVQIRAFTLLGWRLVKQHLAEFGIHRQCGATARTDHFELSRFTLVSRHNNGMLPPLAPSVNLLPCCVVVSFRFAPNPLEDIHNTEKIAAVWQAGTSIKSIAVR